MLSGLYPSVTGVTYNGIEMDERAVTLPDYLKPYGYHTANIGKLHFKNHASFNRDHRMPHPRYGFDTAIISDEPGCYEDAYLKWVAEQDPDAVPLCRCDTPPAWNGPKVEVNPRDVDEPYIFAGPEHLTHSAFVADETCRYIREHQQQPFLCISGFYAPHAPINPPQRFVDMYDIDSMPLPQQNPGENFRETSDGQWRKIKAYYYALISHIDDQIGRILDTLDSCGLTDDTLIMFTSDHGENLGDHGKINKYNSHDSSSRVPLIVSYPSGLKPQSHRHELIESVDLVPTLLDWSGIQVPPNLQGRSFRPLLEGKAYEPRGSAFIELGEPGGFSYKALRTATHLYERRSDGDEVLYDLQSDPHQLTNIAEAPAHREALEGLRAKLLGRWFDVQSRDAVRTGPY